MPFAEKERGQTYSAEEDDYTKEQLMLLLDERDKFIVEKGLWSEFVAWLVSSQTK